jgi:hypothetical protein
VTSLVSLAGARQIHRTRRKKESPCNDEKDAPFFPHRLSLSIRMQNCDWEAHPATHILSLTRHGKYIVARKGLPFNDYGLVDAKVAKMQRLGHAEGELSLLWFTFIYQSCTLKLSIDVALFDNLFL